MQDDLVIFNTKFRDLEFDKIFCLLGSNMRVENHGSKRNAIEKINKKILSCNTATLI